MQNLRPCLLLPLILVVVSACAPQKRAELREPEGALAVASFHQPRHTWESLASGDTSLQKAPDEALEELTEKLLHQLEQRGHATLKGPGEVGRCREIVLSGQSGEPRSASEYWAGVGECVSAEYVLVPQLLQWRQRKGGDWGVDSPARVELSMALFDVQEKQVLDGFRVRKEQKSLSENLLQIGAFFRRGGRWLRAEELAAEGIRNGLREMGL